jgi:hypothetical protein
LLAWTAALGIALEVALGPSAAKHALARTMAAVTKAAVDDREEVIACRKALPRMII